MTCTEESSSGVPGSTDGPEVGYVGVKSVVLATLTFLRIGWKFLCFHVSKVNVEGTLLTQCVDTTTSDPLPQK